MRSKTSNRKTVRNALTSFAVEDRSRGHFRVILLPFDVSQEKILKFQIWVNIGYFLVKHWEFNGKLVSIPILGKEIHFPTLVSHI